MANSSRRGARASNPAQLLSLFLAFILAATVGGVLAAGLAVPAVTSVGAMANAGTKLFDDLPTELGSEELSEQSRMYASDGSLLATFYAENRIVVSIDDISDQMKESVVAVEDHRFFEHGGVDPEGLMRAAVTNLSSSQVQGGSTLTQQYVKNVLIEAGRISGDPDEVEAATAQTLGRKLREAKLAIALERVRDKDEILQGYLNIAQFGPSTYGVEAASRYYFDKNASELNYGESALLAGMTQNPARYDPIANPDAAEQRRNTVLGLLRNQGKITQDQFDKASNRSIEDQLVDNPRLPGGCSSAGSAAYFCQYVTRSVLADPAFGEDTDARRDLLTRGGLEIYTTIDLDMQDQAQSTIEDFVPTGDPSEISTAISTVEPGTGEIKAMAQNTSFGGDGGNELNFNVDRAFGGGQGFQTGSTFKIYVLAEWLRAGNSLADIVDGSPGQEFPREDWNFSCAPNVADDYEPRNIEGIGTGPMSVLNATQESVNTAYVDMAVQLDMCRVDEIARDTGVHLGTGTDPESGRPLRLTPSMVLGANEIAPLTMAASVATFASGGTYCQPMAITSVEDAEGQEIFAPEPQCERVLEDNVVNGVNHALQLVVSERRGTGWRSELPDRPSAGKTGTSNDNTNAWFVGYVPQLATSIWVGHDEATISMGNVVINGTPFNPVFGGNLPAPMWADYMTEATRGMDVEDFPDATDRVIQGERVGVPNVTGWSVNGARSNLENSGFRVQIGSSTESSIPEGDVASTSPSAGSQVRPGSTITINPSSGPPPPEDDEDEDEDNGDDSNDDDDDNGNDNNNSDDDEDED